MNSDKDKDLPYGVSRVSSTMKTKSATKPIVEVVAEVVDDEKRVQQLRDTLFQYVGKSVTLNDAAGPVVGEVVSARLAAGMPKDPKKLVLTVRVLDDKAFPTPPEMSVGAAPMPKTDVSTRPAVQQKVGAISVTRAQVLDQQ